MDASYTNSICSYIEQNAPRDFGLHTLVIYPFHEVIRNFSEVKNANKSLLKRVSHVLAAIAYLIPIINTILFVALRTIFCKPIFRDNVHPIEVNLADERRMTIDELNRQRDPLREQLAQTPKTELETRNALNNQIMDLEQKGAEQMFKRATKPEMHHLRMVRRNDPSFKKYDGRALFKTSKELNGSTFLQVPALSQVDEGNWFCGYYALFSMLQMATGGDVLNRTKGNLAIKEWISLIATKRAKQYLHGQTKIPYGLELSVKGLSEGEIKYLIHKSQFLSPLRGKLDCFYLDLNEFKEPARTIKENNQSYLIPSEPVKQLVDAPLPKDPPYSFILKKGFHFFYVFQKEPRHFIFTSSLDSYSIGNWSDNNFQDLEACLTKYVRVSSQTLSLQEP